MPVYDTIVQPTVVNRVVAPQRIARPTISLSPTRAGKTLYGLAPKSAITSEKPIVKVSTTKQAYYPASQNHVEEHLEMDENMISTSPRYYTTYEEPFYQQKRYSPDLYSPKNRYNHK